MSIAVNGYEVVESVISKEVCNFTAAEIDLYEQAFFKQNNISVEDHYIGDSMVAKAFPMYCPLFSETLLKHIQPLIESVVGEELLPCYSFVRKYYKGAVLKPHYDRDSCEYSATLTLKYIGNIWPIYMRNKNGDIGKAVLEQGSMIVYEGNKLEHWRDSYQEGEVQYQVFLHYVKKNGKYNDYAYDKRPYIGISDVANLNYVTKRSSG